MKASPPAASPATYVGALSGWQRSLVKGLRTAVRASGKLEEVIKWGNIVYFSNGPVIVIRAEAERVLFGFWRGQLLRELDERLKPGGKYEMATITLKKGDTMAPARVKRLVKAAIALNKELGDPT